MKCKRIILGFLLIFASVCLFSEEVKKSEENKEIYSGNKAYLSYFLPFVP